jgi:hypothetical protein
MAKKSLFSDEQLAPYNALINSIKGLERKGVTMPYTSVNGHMFSFIDKDLKLSLRLSAEDKTAFEEKYKSTPSIQHGVVMKEYVLVPDALFQKTKELAPWFKKGFEYTSSLKPKPTKK